jgi:uncharacterized membrane protein SpoIIM required for sporulation
MRILKIILIGLSLSIAGTIGLQFLWFVISVLRGHAETNHATGSSAVLGGLLDATIFNPIVWILIIASFGLAYWLTKPRT